MADLADQRADTESRIAETMEAIAETGDPGRRAHRSQLAEEARAVEQQERVEAEKWRSRHAMEGAARSDDSGV